MITSKKIENYYHFIVRVVLLGEVANTRMQMPDSGSGASDRLGSSYQISTIEGTPQHERI